MKEALIIVDVQNDFCPGGSLAVNEGDKIVEPINSMTKFARQKGIAAVASRDWHPNETVHFNSWPKHCLQDTKGGAFHKDLDLKGVEIFSKGMNPNEDSYSAFDGTNKEGQSLEDYLRLASVTSVYIGGLATDYCVKATALGALVRGFETFLLEDAIRAVDINPGDGQKAIDEMKDNGVIITSTSKVISSRNS